MAVGFDCDVALSLESRIKSALIAEAKLDDGRRIYSVRLVKECPHLRDVSLSA
jgi:hypothetical protein